MAPKDHRFSVPQTILIGDSSGGDAPPLDAEVLAALALAGLPGAPPARHQGAGNSRSPGTHEANVEQQRYFADATTRAVLPLFKQRERPFVLLYWSRDPDGSQHNQGDELNALTPGINGPTSKAAVNFVAAIGPDFKAQYRDPMPASNADITPTLLQLLGWASRAHGVLAGPALDEALRGRPTPGAAVERCLAVSKAAADGRRTALEY